MTRRAGVALMETEQAWPNFAQTAELLDVDRSTLTRQAQAGHLSFVTRGIGRGERLVPLAEVIRLACAYRRVPIDDVLRRLAQQVAGRVAVDEATVLAELRDLHAAVCTRALGTPTSVPAPTSGRLPKPGNAVSADAGPASRHRRGPRVVPLGRLSPQVMREDAFPAAELFEAIDGRRPLEPQPRVIVRRPRVVNLGRLRPGDRF